MKTRSRRTPSHQQDGNDGALGAVAGIVVCLIAISLLVPRPSRPRPPRERRAAVAAEESVDAPPTPEPQSVEQVAPDSQSSTRGADPSDASRSLSDPRTPPPPPAGLPNKFELAKYQRPDHTTSFEPQANTVRSGMLGEESAVPRRPSTADEVRTRRLTQEAQLTEAIAASPQAGATNTVE